MVAGVGATPSSGTERKPSPLRARSLKLTTASASGRRANSLSTTPSSSPSSTKTPSSLSAPTSRPRNVGNSAAAGAITSSTKASRSGVPGGGPSTAIGFTGSAKSMSLHRR
jgi:hypothetical protein